MTVQTILRRAVSLLGAAAGEPNAMGRRQRMLTALDSVIGELARTFPIQARCRLKFQDGEAELPDTVLTPRALLREGRRVPLVLNEGRLLAPDGDYTLIYYRKPPAASAMGENEELPYPEDVLRALPFYCAALCVMGEDNSLYNQLMEQYNTKLSAALGYRPVAGVENGGRL